MTDKNGNSQRSSQKSDIDRTEMHISYLIGTTNCGNISNSSNDNQQQPTPLPPPPPIASVDVDIRLKKEGKRKCQLASGQQQQPTFLLVSLLVQQQLCTACGSTGALKLVIYCWLNRLKTDAGDDVIVVYVEQV